MLDVDFDDLDLGSKRKPTEWVAVLPVSAQQPRQRSTRQVLKAQKLQQAHKRAKDKDDKPQGAVKKQGIPLFTHAARMQQLAECTDVRQPRPISEEDAAAGAQAFPAENDEGNVEYKLRLKEPNCSPVRFQQLVTQMKYRLAEGNGECFYFVGVEDDGYPRGLTQADLDTSLATLHAMAEEVHAATTLLRKAAGTRKRQCAIVRVHKLCVDDVSYTDLRIAVAGSVDAGKSSLVGVLTHGIDGRPLLDNGSGSARMNVFQHKHEIETGRTSSLSQQMLGYDEEGKVLNYAGVSVLTPAEMSASARRVLRFIDLGGHEKYLKTALYGMTCMLPDYVVVCVCPLAGLSRVTHEHLAVALALEVPVAVVITKADIAPPEAAQQVLQDIRRVVSAAAEVGRGGRQNMDDSAAAPYVTHEAQAVKLARQLGSSRSAQPQAHLHQQQCSRLNSSAHQHFDLLVPIFTVSSVTGAGLPVLHAFLNALPALPHAFSPLFEPPCSLPTPAAKLGSSLQHQTTQMTSQSQQESPHFVKSEQNLHSAAENGKSGAAAERQASQATAASSGLSSVYQGSRQGALTHFQVDHTFEVKGVGCVVSGTVVSGEVAVGQKLNLGPMGWDGFTQVYVTCIHRSQSPVRHVRSGQHATVALHPCGLPLQPSTATQRFSQDTSTSSQPPSPATQRFALDTVATTTLPAGTQTQVAVRSDVASAAFGIAEVGRTEASTTGAGTIDASTAAAGTTLRQHWPQQVMQHQSSSSAVSGHSAVQTPAQHALPAGLMTQALTAHAVADTPHPQQTQDPFVLDHRIHHPSVAGLGQQQVPAAAVVDTKLEEATAVVDTQTAEATAVGHTAGTVSAVPIRCAKQLLESQQSQGLQGCNHTGPQHAQHGPVSSSPLTDQLEAQHAQHEAVSSSPVLAGPSPPNARKGMVLLDTAIDTHVVWTFEAVIVLLNGHWPPRGLLSGKWPPKPNTPDTVLAASPSESPLGASDSDPDVTPSARPRQSADAYSPTKRFDGTKISSSVGRCSKMFDRPPKKRQSAAYTPVIHCGSVRQAAQVMAMEEIRLAEPANDSSLHLIDGCQLSSAIAAAAAMQCYTSEAHLNKAESSTHLSSDGSGDDAHLTGRHSDVGTIAHVVLKFQHRPEWLMKGSRVIMRDRTDGCTAGAGVIRTVYHSG